MLLIFDYTNKKNVFTQRKRGRIDSNLKIKMIKWLFLLAEKEELIRTQTTSQLFHIEGNTIKEQIVMMKSKCRRFFILRFSSRGLQAVGARGPQF